MSVISGISFKGTDGAATAPAERHKIVPYAERADGVGDSGMSFKGTDGAATAPAERHKIVPYEGGSVPGRYRLSAAREAPEPNNAQRDLRTDNVR
jgi:hypothetical protein